MEEFSTTLIKLLREKEYLFCFLIHSQLRDLKVQNLFCLAKTCFWIFFLLFIQKHLYSGHINKMKKSKTKIDITVTRCKATKKPEIKL